MSDAGLQAGGLRMSYLSAMASPPAWMADRELRDVADAIAASTGAESNQFFGRVVRRSIDEVIDGPRTGRWDFDQLEKTEKTYVGTKVEIVLRTDLGAERGRRLDCRFDDVDFDIKWAMNSTWQIPREAIGELCLCLGGRDDLKYFQVGLVRCREAYLNPGQNRDGKKTLSAIGRAAMMMLVDVAEIPPNFVASMDPATRERVMSEPTIQRRVTRLFKELPGVAIPRDAVRTVAQTEGDPMRRLRADKHAGDPLQGMKVLSAKYNNVLAQALGYPRLERDEFIGVEASEIAQLSAGDRARLPGN